MKAWLLVVVFDPDLLLPDYPEWRDGRARGAALCHARKSCRAAARYYRHVVSRRALAVELPSPDAQRREWAYSICDPIRGIGVRR